MQIFGPGFVQGLNRLHSPIAVVLGDHGGVFSEVNTSRADLKLLPRLCRQSGGNQEFEACRNSGEGQVEMRADRRFVSVLRNRQKGGDPMKRKYTETLPSFIGASLVKRDSGPRAHGAMKSGSLNFTISEVGRI